MGRASQLFQKGFGRSSSELVTNYEERLHKKKDKGGGKLGTASPQSVEPPPPPSLRSKL
jgi:hypothetical protein